VHLSSQQDGAVALRAEGLSKRFGPVRAVDDVSLKVRAGEVLALVGENGAGKSTVLKILSGEYAPDRGRVLLGGEKVDVSSPRAAHAAGIRVIHQEPEIIPQVSVAENVYVGALPARGRLLDRRGLLARRSTASGSPACSTPRRAASASRPRSVSSSRCCGRSCPTCG
jgi:ABC-type sugar transport system ATPase subunit